MKNPLHYIEADEAKTSLNTVFGAALGSYLGLSLQPLVASVGPKDLLIPFFALTFTVAILQVLIRIPVKTEVVPYAITSLMGGAFFYVGRREIADIGVDTSLLDAIFAAWAFVAVVLNQSIVSKDAES